MSILAVDGARLHYETRGQGPPLVMIPGASGDTRVFGAVGEHLAEHHTVLTYDRRGFSRSTLTGPQDYAHRLETDADDVARLIEHHGAGPASVFGTSSGAVVALTVLSRHPGLVDTLIPYEPASMWLLPDGSGEIEFIEHLYDLYRAEGVVPAMTAFRERNLTPGDREFVAGMPAADTEHQHANTTYWFERELRQYPTAELDLDALRRHANRVVPLAGADSRGYPVYEVSAELARILERPLTETPGGHIALGSHPDAFSRTLHRLLTNSTADSPTTESDPDHDRS